MTLTPKYHNKPTIMKTTKNNWTDIIQVYLTHEEFKTEVPDGVAVLQAVTQGLRLLPCINATIPLGSYVLPWIFSICPMYYMDQKQSYTWTNGTMAGECRLALWLRAKGKWFCEQLAIDCWTHLSWHKCLFPTILHTYTRPFVPKVCNNHGWSENWNLSRIYKSI